MSVILKNPRGENPRKPHTVRYWVDGRKREKSFTTLAQARAFKTDTDHAARYGAEVDDRACGASFGEACQTWVARLACSTRTRQTYTEVYARHVAPAFGTRTLASVAGDRDAVAGLITVTMGGMSIGRRRHARRIITGTLDEAIAAGKIRSHRCAGIGLADNGARNEHSDFVFPSHAQVAAVADAVGIATWLMRGCGLRIEEALAVERADFRDGGKTLRVCGQATRDGSAKVVLKYRRPGQFRDVPCPGWLWDMVRGLPDGALCPGTGQRYMTYSAALHTFSRAAVKAGIPAGFVPHSLRHAFASALLARGVPITDVAVWLGHRNVQTTFETYHHLIPSAAPRASALLEAEYAEWRGADLQTA